MNRLSECLLHRPSVAKSAPQSSRADAKSRSPIGKQQSFAAKSDALSSSGVEALLLGGSPSAILRAVVASIIDPLKGHTFRRMPHVGKEVLELVPSLTDADSTRTVFFEAGNARIMASTNHVVPAAIDGRRAEAVCPLLGSKKLFMKAAAGLGFASHQMEQRYLPHRSAIASAKPIKVLSNIRLTPLKRRPSSETVAFSISEHAVFRGHAEVLTNKAVQAKLSER